MKLKVDNTEKTQIIRDHVDIHQNLTKKSLKKLKKYRLK